VREKQSNDESQLNEDKRHLKEKNMHEKTVFAAYPLSSLPLFHKNRTLILFVWYVKLPV
jgi:hypothetical protein